MEYLQDHHFEIAEKNGLKKATVYSRVYSYMWPIEKAITEPVKIINRGWAEYKEIAEKHGIKRSTYISRVKSGMPHLEAATKPLATKEEWYKSIVESGKKRRMFTEEQVAIAEKNGISYETARIRHTQHNWSIERAITEPVNTKFRRKTKEG